MEAHQAAQDLVVGRHLHAREELLEDAARLEGLPDRRRHLGDLVERDRGQLRLRSRDLEASVTRLSRMRRPSSERQDRADAP